MNMAIIREKQNENYQQEYYYQSNLIQYNPNNIQFFFIGMQKYTLKAFLAKAVYSQNGSESQRSVIEQASQIISQEKQNKQFPVGKCISLIKLIEKSTSGRIDLQTTFSMRGDNCQIVSAFLSHVSFPSLKYLRIDYNQIKRVEFLATLNAPNLEILYMSDNHICYLRSLRKSQFPLLSDLNFRDNKIKEVCKIEETYFKPDMDAITFDCYSQSSHQDLGIAVKLQVSHMNTFYCSGTNRIQQGTVRLQIAQKIRRSQTNVPVSFS